MGDGEAVSGGLDKEGAEESAVELTKPQVAPQDAIPSVEAAAAAPAPAPVPDPLLPPVPPAPVGYFPPVPPPPPGYQLPVPQAQPSGPRSRKPLYLSLAVAGWLVVAAGTATTVVAVGSDGGGSTVAAATPLPSASATPSAAATTAAPTPTQTVAPTPTSTVKGWLSGHNHAGDLRFFLLPVPDDAAAYGNPDGDSLSVTALSKTFDNPSTSKRILNDYGCSGGAFRSYRTNDGNFTVKTQLIRFDGSGHASDWVTGLSFGKGNSFDVAGIQAAQGHAFDPTSSDSTGELVGISHVGDVEYEITVIGTGKLAHSLLTPLMQREEKRLTTGH